MTQGVVSLRYRFSYRQPHQGRVRILLSGPDRKRFLHGMVTNDINGLSPGQGCHAAMLSIKGKMLSDMLIYDCRHCGDSDEDELLLELEASARDKILAALNRHLIMDDVQIED